jgi:hypothetical protein
VYVKGVGVGRGVSAATTPSGIWSAPVGEIDGRVEVRNGIRVEGGEVESIPCEAQELRREKKEEKKA